MSGKIYETAKVWERTEIESDSSHWFIGDFCLITLPKLVMNRGAQINAGSKILGRGEVRIGRYAVVSFDCLLMTSSDSPSRAYASDFLPETVREVVTGPIVLEDHAFVGAKTVIMPGVTIPEGCVIGSGSYVDSKTKLEPWRVYVPSGRNGFDSYERKVMKEIEKL
jgi:acetyltransferase-like isoleucine patch superfamily enzyme